MASNDQNIRSAAKLYENLTSDRDPFLRRARDGAKLTIPTLMPEEGANGSTVFPTPWQSVGARGVNNLASKLLVSLLPPNTPPFRLEIDDFALQALAQDPEVKSKVDYGLNRIERAVQTEIETNAIRVGAFEALKQLICCGNALLYLMPEGGMKVFHLDTYVIRRDAAGNPLDIIVKECIDRDILEATIGPLPDDVDTDENKDELKNEVTIYTHVKRNPKKKKWDVYQEVCGQKIAGTTGSYPIDKSPWIPVRFTSDQGEDYGRGYVEEYIGDLRSLEGLAQAIVEGSVAAAKVLFLVNPNGQTEMDDLAEAANGDFKAGRAEDVTTLQLQKFNDFRVASETSRNIEERLAFAFLLNSAVQRSGERVTAEEIRYMANELEAALGGIYSVLSQEFQLPLIKRLMYQMERQGRLPPLPDKTIKPVIVTGLEALGRGNDLEKLNQFIGTIAQIPEAVQRVNWGDYLNRLAASIGINTDGLVKTDQQVAQEQQQAMMAQMVQQGLNPAITQAGQVIKQGVANNGQQQSQQ